MTKDELRQLLSKNTELIINLKLERAKLCKLLIDLDEYFDLVNYSEQLPIEGNQGFKALGKRLKEAIK